MMLDSLLKTILSSAIGSHRAFRGVEYSAERNLIAGKGMIAELIQLAPELPTPSERLPFNTVCRDLQMVAWASFRYQKYGSPDEGMCNRE